MTSTTIVTAVRITTTLVRASLGDVVRSAG